MPFSSERFGLSMSMQVHTSTETITPGSRLIRNSQCHELCSVIQPPSEGPMVGAMVATSPISTEMLLRHSRGNIMKLAANVTGIIAPPMKPWMARNTIMDSMSPASAHSSELSAKPADEIVNSTRVDISRAR